jgi:hypothetical protein
VVAIFAWPASVINAIGLAPAIASFVIDVTRRSWNGRSLSTRSGGDAARERERALGRRFSSRNGGQTPPVRRYRGIGLLPVVWIVVGVVVAAIYDYFDSLSTLGRILTAIAAVLLWPLLLFGFDITIKRG